jgi:predicted O-methyltransferase YrrM
MDKDEHIKFMNFTNDEEYQKKYNDIYEAGRLLLPTNFNGSVFRLANFWFDTILPRNVPIKYLELGILYGANALSVANSYCKHPKSEIHCIDPWERYTEEGSETYENIQDIYDICMGNIEHSGHKHKFHIYKDYSYNVLPTFPEHTFDMIYIDGNHEQTSVLEDLVLSFRKLKKNGYLIMDDAEWGTASNGMIAFIKVYESKIDILYSDFCQLIVRKK